jgi:hypothetical protein
MTGWWKNVDGMISQGGIKVNEKQVQESDTRGREPGVGV